jgi:hypothetical protein
MVGAWSQAQHIAVYISPPCWVKDALCVFKNLKSITIVPDVRATPKGHSCYKEWKRVPRDIDPVVSLEEPPAKHEARRIERSFADAMEYINPDPPNWVKPAVAVKYLRRGDLSKLVFACEALGF